MTRRGDDLSDDKTTEAHDTHGEAPALGAYRLGVVAGADLGASMVLDASTPSRVLVGQGRACELVLNDARVSRRHVAFDLVPQGVRVTDLGSRNGTRVNGLRVGECLLEGGELVTIGQTTLRLDGLASRTPARLSLNAGFGRLVGSSLAMRRLYPLCERIAMSDLPVVIEGETGTGKELLAEAIHETSPRRAKPFVVFDCLGTPGEAASYLLFGPSRPLVEQAAGGTLLLDEISDLAEDAQARLLRFLDQRSDVRIIVATRRELDAEVQAGRFRDDLFFRLVALRVELPPLREREGDVALLAHLFWKRAAPNRPFPADFLARYESYRWPGNVRELDLAVGRRATLGALEPELRPSRDDPNHDVVDRILAKNLPLAAARHEMIDEFERRYVTKVLDAHGGSVTRAATASGVARRYFQILRARHK